jgi:hypothetical protein
MLTNDEKKARHTVLVNTLTAVQKDRLTAEVEDSVEEAVANGSGMVDIYEIACKLFFQRGAEQVSLAEINSFNNSSAPVLRSGNSTFQSQKEIYAHLAAGGTIKYRDGTKYVFNESGRLVRDGDLLPRKDSPSFAYFEAWTSC